MIASPFLLYAGCQVYLAAGCGAFDVRPESVVHPLPDGLDMVSDTSQCDGGSQIYCSNTVVVRTAPGQTQDHLMETLVTSYRSRGYRIERKRDHFSAEWPTRGHGTFEIDPAGGDGREVSVTATVPTGC